MNEEMAPGNVSRQLPLEKPGLQGSKKDIFLSLAVISVPMVILAAVILGIIAHNQVPQTYSALPSIPNPVATESTAFLVDFSATRLLTVAS
jgi:hypothetical protein